MGTAERREREKQERRAQILKSARKLFWKNGFSSTTMPAIAKAAELAPGTLYLYFPSKEALYIELLVEGYEPLLDRLRSAVSSVGEPRAQAEALIDAFVGYARERPEYFDIIFFVLQRDAGGPRETLVDPDQLRRLDVQERACKDVAAEVLARLRPEFSAEQLQLTVEAVWSMLVGVVFYFRRDGDERFADLAGHARDLILRAVDR
jgi:AcrR family transcriptional regulator